MHVSVCVCTYLMVTANQKSVSYTDTHTRKESNHNTRNSHQITRDESKRRERNKKDPQKQTPQSEQNDSKHIPINNFSKRKSSKYSNENIWSDRKGFKTGYKNY